MSKNKNKNKTVGHIKNQNNSLEVKSDSKFNVMTFNAETFDPQPKTNKKLSANTWGKNNEYSKFLKDLYHSTGNPLHRNSIDKKIRFSVGNDIEFIDEMNIDITDELKLISKNYEIYNCYAIIVGYDRLGNLSTFKSVNIDNLAFYYDENDEDNEKGFWISRDFKKHTKPQNKPEFYPVFNPSIKDKLSIYFYSDEPVDWKYPEFPTPVYNNGTYWIRLSRIVGKYQLDNTVSGFEGSYLINFPTGIPDKEERDKNFRDFKRVYTGQNAQKIIMSYSEPDGEQPEITPVPSDSNDTKFLETVVHADIVTVDSHQIPLPMMIIRGQTLAGTDERNMLMKEFQMSYINPRQRDIENGVNKILKTVNNKVKLGNYFTDENNEEMLEDEK